MRCSASPTTCTAPEQTRAAARDAAARVVTALLFREALKPLAAGLGPVAETALGAVADSFATRTRLP